MRFIIKSAFWLGLIAFLLPGTGHNGTTSGLSLAGVFDGASQAFDDFTGFCSRAPKACTAGQEFAVFAGERIGDGVALVYGMVEGNHPAPLARQGHEQADGQASDQPDGRATRLAASMPAARPEGTADLDTIASAAAAFTADSLARVFHGASAPPPPSPYRPPVRSAASQSGAFASSENGSLTSKDAGAPKQQPRSIPIPEPRA